MSDVNNKIADFYNPIWQEKLRQVHKEMMDEKAFFEEMSDDIELTESDVFAMAHYFEGDQIEDNDQPGGLSRGRSFGDNK